MGRRYVQDMRRARLPSGMLVMVAVRWLHIDYRGRVIREFSTRAAAMRSCSKLWRHCGDKVRRATLTYRV